MHAAAFAFSRPVFWDDVPANKSALRKLLTKGLWRSEIPLFGVEFVILKGEKRKLRAIFVAIGRFFENQHILSLAGSGRAHDSFNLRFRHTGGHLVIIVYGQLGTGKRVSIAARRESD